MAGELAINRVRNMPAEDTPAFGAIAERFRRGGDLERAVQLCRDGLTKFPNQLSARVTLGWALLDLGRYDEARAELEQVLRRAPDNLAAIRGLAELHDRAENAVLMDGPGAWPPDPETVDATVAHAESHRSAPVEPAEIPDTQHEARGAVDDTATVLALLDESDRLEETGTVEDAAPLEGRGSAAAVELLSPAAAAMAAAGATPGEAQADRARLAEPVTMHEASTPFEQAPGDDAPIVEFSPDPNVSLDESVSALGDAATEPAEEPVVELSSASLEDLARAVEAMGVDSHDVLPLHDEETDVPAAMLTESVAPPTPEVGDLVDLPPVVAAEQTARAFVAELKAVAPVELRPQTRATIVRLERFLKKVEARGRRLARESVA